MDTYEVAVLAEDYRIKRERWEALRLVNIANRTDEERAKLNAEYHVAEAEAIQAYRALERAKVS